MKIRKVDPIKEAQILFEIDNKAFTRSFDLPSRNIEEQINYLKDSQVYLVNENEKLIGFFAYAVRKTETEIKNIIVLPEHQGKGYGKQMVKELLKLVKPPKVWLVTHPKNIYAILLYLKSGFEIAAWKDNYYGDGHPRLLLKLLK